jgi:cohesin loading factor subunit SCC2
MLFEKSPSFFKYPSPETPTSASPNGQIPLSSTAKQRSPLVKKSESPQISGNAAIHSQAQKQAQKQREFKIEVAIPSARQFDPTLYMETTETVSPRAIMGPPTPSQVIATLPVADSTPVPPTITPNETLLAPSSFVIEIPQPNAFDKSQYMEIPDITDAPLNLSQRKSKTSGFDGSHDAFAASLDQRERAEGALHDLHKLTQEAFTAVGHAFGMESGYSHIAVLNADQEPTLTAGINQKIQTAIQKTITLGCYNKVPLDDLLRLQKLCESSLKQVESLDYKIEESWGEPEIQTWLQGLPDLEAGLKAARTALRIMSGGREDKQIYSEGTIQKCLDLFKNVMDGIIIPLVELRSSGTSSDLFKLISPHKKAIAPVFVNSQKLFGLMAGLVTSIELSETVINTLEFAASKLIFVENAHFEKDSAVGVQKFDGIRLVAMDMLCQIFLINPQQRQGIFDDILTSLEKLPVGKQSARQFRLADGGSIQPVSALIMRLVQASSGQVDDKRGMKRGTNIKSGDEDEDNLANEVKTEVPASTEGAMGTVLATIRTEDDGAFQHSVAVRELQDVILPLTETAKRNASYVVNFIVNRALKSTKTGDTPYRNLLDLFVEDFTSCLDTPDWPAAETLLRFFTVMMVKLSEGEKTAAPAKNMALELLGTMGAAISRLRSHVRKTASAIDGIGSDELSRFLSELAHGALAQRSRPEHMTAWSGPYRATLEYLEERCSDDPHLKSAISFLITDWADKVQVGHGSYQDEDPERDQEFGRLAYRLRKMIDDRRWLTNEYSFKTVTTNQAKLSYAIILLRSQFCESFGVMLNILLGSMASDQATVRSKSLRSINQLLETDPSILDGDSVVIQLILQCSNDTSTQVRDSALGLIGKCINMRPVLEEKMTPRVIERFIDSGVGVRKRAMKLAKDIYLRNRSKDIRSAIANGLLHRVQDPDEGVRELARQMIEEVWFTPFYNAENTATFKTSLTDHVALIIQTFRSGNVSTILDKVLQSILGPQNKASEGPFGVCIQLVANMFELIDNLDSDDPSIPSGRDALQVLMVFAKADPKLFTFEQIRLLKPHLSSFSGNEDLAVFRAVVVVYRRVLPQVSTAHSNFLSDVRVLLQKAIGKVSRALLDDVIACAWIISGLLEQYTPLARLACSSLSNIQKLRAVKLDEKRMSMIKAYALIIGMVGKHCDLDSQITTFKEFFPKWAGNSVAKLMVDILAPFTAPQQPQEARKAALDAMGLVCQSWPRNYVSPNVYTTFQQVFDEQIPVLENMILRSFKEFLITEEKRSEAASASDTAPSNDGEKKRELTVMGGTNYDDVASATTQRFLKEFTRIAVSSQDETAFLAVEVLGSINRQGLVHPKETGVTLITLETSSMQKIAELAFQEHRALHEKHETVLEREYAKAIQAAFCYQRDVVHDTHGATTNPFQSKLHLLVEVLKISKPKSRERFLDKFCGQIDFDPQRIDASSNMPHHVEFSRFLIENLAFFDYMTLGELLVTVNKMEKLVTSTGASVAHAIESGIFNVRMDVDPTPEMQLEGVTTPAPLPIDMKRLRQLTAASMIFLSVWEARTFLRRLYGLGTHRRDPKAKGAAKDLNKAPIKLQFITGDKFWEEVASNMAALESQENMMQKCKAFVELLNVDKEFKVAEDDEEMNDEERSSGSEDDQDGPSTDRGRKRKAGGTPGGRKKRARSSSKQRGRGRPRKQSVDADAEGDFDDTEWL